MKTEEAVDLLKRIIAIPSFSKEEEGVAALMTGVLEGYGYPVHRKGNNVWACSGERDSVRPTILLDAHIDTVKPTGNWDTHPFSPVTAGDKLFGLGSNDTGGSIVSMLAAFLILSSREQPFNLIYFNSAEEENTGTGGISSVLNELGAIDLAIVGEPTGMHPAIAEKGLMVLDGVAYGKAGHAAREEGINALYELLPDIDWFRNYRFDKSSELLGAVKMSVTGIQAGTLHNVIPSECRYMVDVRVNEHYSNQEVLEVIKTHINSEVSPRSFNLNSSSISPEHPVVRRCELLGRRPYGSPTTSNQAVLPYTSVKLGPGDSARSHTANEYILMDEIREGISLYVDILDGLSI